MDCRIHRGRAGLRGDGLPVSHPFSLLDCRIHRTGPGPAARWIPGSIAGAGSTRAGGRLAGGAVRVLMRVTALAGRIEIINAVRGLSQDPRPRRRGHHWENATKTGGVPYFADRSWVIHGSPGKPTLD